MKLQTLNFWLGDKHEAQALTLDIEMSAPPAPAAVAPVATSRPWAVVEWTEGKFRIASAGTEEVPCTVR